MDEYKHFSIFTNIKNQLILEYKINKKELNFVPNHIYNKGYIYEDHFIFEKKKLNDFAIFIGANEEIAEKKGADMNAASLDAAVRTIEGTARNMGIKVEG